MTLLYKSTFYVSAFWINDTIQYTKKSKIIKIAKELFFGQVWIIIWDEEEVKG